MEIETNGYYNLNTNGVQYFPISVNVAEGGKIQSSKEVSITENGKSYVTPDEGYSGIANVIVSTNVESEVKLQDSKDVTITSNGTSAVVPDTGYTAIKSVFVTTQVPVPESEASKSIDVVENGSYTITPTAPYEAMKSVTCNVNVPIKSIQAEKVVDVVINGSMTIKPNVGYDGIASVVVNTNVSGGNYNITQIKRIYDNNEYMYQLSDIVKDNGSSSKSIFVQNGALLITKTSSGLYYIRSPNSSTSFNVSNKYIWIDLSGEFLFMNSDGLVFIHIDRGDYVSLGPDLTITALD